MESVMGSSLTCEQSLSSPTSLAISIHQKKHDTDLRIIGRSEQANKIAGHASTLPFFLCVLPWVSLATTGTRSIRYHHESTLAFHFLFFWPISFFIFQVSMYLPANDHALFVVHQASMS